VCSDGTIAVEELTYLSAVFHDGMSWQEERSRATMFAARYPELASQVPDFFLAACRCDAATGTHTADSMLGEIDAICEIMVRADGQVVSDEARFVHTLLRTLRDAQARHQLPLGRRIRSANLIE
jgi:hypothetical protein